MFTHDSLVRAGTIIGWLVGGGLLTTLAIAVARWLKSEGRSEELLSTTSTSVTRLGEKLDAFSTENKREHEIIRDRLEGKIEEVNTALRAKNDNEHARWGEWGDWRITVDGRLKNLEDDRRVGPVDRRGPGREGGRRDSDQKAS